MNGSHVVAASGVTSALASVLMWISACLEKGQLLQLNTESAVAMATLIVTVLGGGSMAAWANRHKTKETTTIETTNTPPAVPPAPITPTPEAKP